MALSITVSEVVTDLYIIDKKSDFLFDRIYVSLDNNDACRNRIALPFSMK